MNDLDKMLVEGGVDRREYAKIVAEDICSVQPMPVDSFKRMYENSLSEEELIEQGYEPLDPHGLRLTWVKKK